MSNDISKVNNITTSGDMSAFDLSGLGAN